VDIHRGFRSHFLAGERNISVWLPPDYEASHGESPRQRYPVLYLQDGQNIFDPETAFIRGQPWWAGESAEALVRAGDIPPLVIVAIDNAGEARVDEYTPTRSAHLNRGGMADQYGRMLMEEVMPMIAASYRIAKGPRATALGGSSLGGLLTLYLGMRNPRVFGKLAVMSPSLWWDNRAILQMVAEAELRPRPRIWLDVGTAEAKSKRAATRDARLLRRILTRRGWRGGRNLMYMEDEGAGHNELAWAHRFPMMLRFLFG
jgi:predicted alpha/beta superfamily hydrolase